MSTAREHVQEKRDDSRCQGCGAPIEQPSTGRRRKWCSDRCRKHSYDRECIDCGARVDGTTPSRMSGRCLACAAKHPRSADVIKRATIEALWADGHTLRAICAFMGLKHNNGLLGIWRRRGYDLPYRRTPEQVARITAGSGAKLAKARRVHAERLAA